MTEQVNSNPRQPPFRPFLDRMVFRTASPTEVLWIAGGALTLAGIEWPENWALVYSGLGILLLAYILGKYTRMGREGPVTLKQQAIYGPDGKVERVRYQTALLSPANLLRFIGTGLAATGLYWHFNIAMMVSGLVIVAAGLYLGGRRELDEGLDPASAMLPKFGDEVRSEKGYVVRRAENGLRYSVDGHALMLRNDQLSIRYVEVPNPDGSITKRKVVHIDAGHFHMHWDAPHDKELISLARLFEISSHLGEVLNSGKLSCVRR
jgi:hypothetical protein